MSEAEEETTHTEDLDMDGDLIFISEEHIDLTDHSIYTTANKEEGEGATIIEEEEHCLEGEEQDHGGEEEEVANNSVNDEGDGEEKMEGGEEKGGAEEKTGGMKEEGLMVVDEWDDENFESDLEDEGM